MVKTREEALKTPFYLGLGGFSEERKEVRKFVKNPYRSTSLTCWLSAILMSPEVIQRHFSNLRDFFLETALKLWHYGARRKPKTAMDSSQTFLETENEV